MKKNIKWEWKATKSLMEEGDFALFSDKHYPVWVEYSSPVPNEHGLNQEGFAYLVPAPSGYYIEPAEDSPNAYEMSCDIMPDENGATDDDGTTIAVYACLKRDKQKDNEYNFLDEIMHFSIHEDDFNRLPKNVQKIISEYEDIRLYPKGKKIDKVKEFKRVLKEYYLHIKKEKETNVECIMIDQMLELLDTMYAKDIRKLKLEKLLK